MQTDAEFLGLTPGDGPGRYQFTVENHLARLDGRLYGGTAIAVSIAVAELVSERTGVWMTTQFVATAPPDERITVVAEVLAAGRRTNQVRVTGTNPAGDTMFASLGATGHHRESGLAGSFERAPTVSSPEDSEPWYGPLGELAEVAGIDAEVPTMPTDIGFSRVIEFRSPTVEAHPDPGPGRQCLWVRRRNRQPVSATIAAYMADMVPLSIAMAAKVLAVGISLDNTIRVGAFEPTEWILVDLRPHLAAGDYGHGAAHLWNENLELMGTASQTAAMTRFSPDNPPWGAGDS